MVSIQEMNANLCNVPQNDRNRTVCVCVCSFIYTHVIHVIHHVHLSFLCVVLLSGLSKAETQALTNYGSGEDENEEEEMEEFEAGPVDVQTSLQASADGQVEQEVSVTVSH